MYTSNEKIIISPSNKSYFFILSRLALCRCTCKDSRIRKKEHHSQQHQFNRFRENKIPSPLVNIRFISRMSIPAYYAFIVILPFNRCLYISNLIQNKVLTLQVLSPTVIAKLK